MSLSSINFQTAKGNSSTHMSRESYTSYLIKHSTNDYNYKKYNDKDEYLEFAKIQTKLKTKRSMQNLAIKNFVQEAVINIKEDTKIEDLESLFNKLHKQYTGFKVFEIAMHKDEGVFIDTKHDIKDLVHSSKTAKWFKDGVDVSDEVISLAPNKDIFYNKDNEKWYKEKSFETEIDTSKLQMKMNYHAHVSFTKWDEALGKNARLLKKDMSTIQTITAEHLGMERGEKHSKSKRMNHYQIKKMYAEINEQKVEKQELKVEIKREKGSSQGVLSAFDLVSDENKELKATVAKLKEANSQFRIDLKASEATRADYAALEQTVRELKLRIKNKDLTIDEMNLKFAELEKALVSKKVSETNGRERTNALLNELKVANSDSSRFKELFEKAKKVNQSKSNNEAKLAELVEAPENKQSVLFRFIITKFKELKETISTLQNQNKTLQEQNEALSDELRSKTKTMDSRPILQSIKTELDEIEDDIFTREHSDIDIEEARKICQDTTVEENRKQIFQNDITLLH